MFTWIANVLTGIGRLINLSKHSDEYQAIIDRYDYVKSRMPAIDEAFAQDRTALYEDWKKVGDDLRRAAEAFDEQNKQALRDYRDRAEQ